MLRFDADTMTLADAVLTYADRPHQVVVRGWAGDRPFAGAHLVNPQIHTSGPTTVLEAAVAHTPLTLRQEWTRTEESLCEQTMLTNAGDVPVMLDHVGIGLAADLERRDDWRLVAIPFRRQLNGASQEFTGRQLRHGVCHNVVYADPTRPEPQLTEQDILRSEAWAWGTGDRGIVVMKYNRQAIELSVVGMAGPPESRCIRFGGVGLSLYGEPSACRRLTPQQRVVFGTTCYRSYEGGLEQAFYHYRDFLDAHGHATPASYDPPLNWNELYDIGWLHNNKEQLAERYTRTALLDEARKARDSGCDLLYLDPGWEVFEGSTRWDESRLGTTQDLVSTLRQQFDLGLGFRTILRCHGDPAEADWPADWLVQRAHGWDQPITAGAPMWELCLCHQPVFDEKVRRIVDIAKHGVRFLMVDEYDWRGPCVHPGHTHAGPTTAADHAEAVYRLCRTLRQQCPGLVIECHDPIWPWHLAVYTPMYYRQGFDDADPWAAYQENWGFEYMWNCLDDLRSGRALSLYDYNLACSIPLYLHITMAADNDACLFFWWAASTVRHLGIGGMTGHPSINPANLPEFDPDRRFAAYRRQVQLYHQLKPYLVRGVFWGLNEDAHLHTLPGRAGGVLILFNRTDETRQVDLRIHADQLGGDDLAVKGAGVDPSWVGDCLGIRAALPPMSPTVVTIGDACCEQRRNKESMA